MSKSRDKTDKRLLDQYLIKQAHIRGIQIDFLEEQEAQDKASDHHQVSQNRLQSMSRNWRNEIRSRDKV